MIYENIDEYLKANTKTAYEIAEKLSEEDKEELTMVLDFLVNKLKENHNIMKWHEDAVKETVTDEQYKMITQLYMTYMNNDFITNCEWGKEMAEKGLINPSGFKLFGKIDLDY